MRREKRLPPKDVLPTPEFYAREARKRLAFYAGVCDPFYEPSRFHYCLADRLQRVATGKARRTITNTPPQHGKSRKTTIEMVSWMLGHDPRKHVAVASYSKGLSTKAVTATRDRFRTAAFQTIFPHARLKRGEGSKHYWQTDKGGSYRAVGIDSGFTGHHVTDLIIDDPHEDFASAQSEARREHVWDWFWSTAFPRVHPQGTITIIMTRWHPDDLVGRLTNPQRIAQIQKMGIPVQPWERLNLSAIAGPGDPIGREEGAALWPERYPAAFLQSVRAESLSYIWSALYEGNPVPKGGNYIDPADFVVISPDQVPGGLQWVRYWDLAESEKKTSDYTAGARVALDRMGNLYIRDILFGQWRWPHAKAKIAQTARDEKILVGVESQGAGMGIACKELADEIGDGAVVREYSVHKDKLTRALYWIAKTEKRKVFLVGGGEWLTAFKAQCESFPNGEHDDMVDAVSGAAQMVAETEGAGRAESLTEATRRQIRTFAEGRRTLF